MSFLDADKHHDLDISGWGFRLGLDGCGCLVLALALSLFVGTVGTIIRMLE